MLEQMVSGMKRALCLRSTTGISQIVPDRLATETFDQYRCLYAIDIELDTEATVASIGDESSMFSPNYFR